MKQLMSHFWVISLSLYGHTVVSNYALIWFLYCI